MTDTSQMPPEAMKKAVKGLSYISHPLRLRILEYLDVNGASSVSAITKGVREEQAIVSQSLRKLREADLVKTKRRGIFIYYENSEEYPASLFVCLRRLYGYMTDSFLFLKDGVKAVLPADYTMMVANQIKLFANYDKMRILEFLTVNGESCVCNIAEALESDQMKVSQNLKRLKDDGFVAYRRDGRFMIYDITNGVHKTAVECIRKRWTSLQKAGKPF